ncbi:MAG TPA: Rieske (2Fe-2S) protein [Planctomycetota bacterium]|nr:Rieske (2Fe-2S) protein [Planctomycetota bacterium]
MDLPRREFLAGCAGCILAWTTASCTAVNPVPLVEAEADGGVPLGDLLKNPGDQIKVRLPGSTDLVLVWRGPIGLGATSIVCTHRGSEVHYTAAANRLDCPSHGSQFGPDGSVVAGPAKRPLAAYRVEVDGGRLRLRPA